jgi:hypothetical protein
MSLSNPSIEIFRPAECHGPPVGAETCARFLFLPALEVVHR